jgi:hypothetical protein
MDDSPKGSEGIVNDNDGYTPTLPPPLPAAKAKRPGRPAKPLPPPKDTYVWDDYFEPTE